MAISNYERVGHAPDLLHAGLYSFLENGRCEPLMAIAS